LNDKELIESWLNSSYEYYWGFDDSGMSDYQWDCHSRNIAANLDKYKEFIPKGVLDKMKEFDWDGGSLFFVPKAAYGRV